MDDELAASWRLYGNGIVAVHNGLPVFPQEQSERLGGPLPGVYRLTLNDGYIYIGQTNDLRRRFREYRRPTQGTEQEYVIRYLLVNAGGARVEVLVGSATNAAQARRAAEKSEIERSKQEGQLLLNRGGRGYPHYLRFRVKYYEEMLAVANDQLEAAGSLCEGETR